MTTPAPPLPTVHCWRIDLDAPRPAGSDQWIATSEHARADRFKFDYLQRRYRATRAGLRMLLARGLGIQPGEVRFVRSARGKPSLDPVHQSNLQFNLTHSEHVAWVAVGPMELGIDLEVLGRQVKMLDSLLHRVTTPDEDQLLMAMPEALRELAFLLMWTRKESALKAWGGHGFAEHAGHPAAGRGCARTVSAAPPSGPCRGQHTSHHGHGAGRPPGHHSARGTGGSRPYPTGNTSQHHAPANLSCRSTKPSCRRPPRARCTDGCHRSPHSGQYATPGAHGLSCRPHQ